MKSAWNNKEAKKCGKDLLKMRVYTSRLLGNDEDLVLHGGGNTSVKIVKKNIFGDREELLYVKGSGWDLATIEAPGFSPVKLESLKKLAELATLSDMDMVKYQRMALTDPAAPNPSVEAILHAIIPFTFVDHTHADAVVVMTNTPGGKERIRNTFGDKILIVPYVMPGFILAKTIYEMTRNINWSELEGMILMNHGVFTFDNDARSSYEKMIKIVSTAERYLKKEGAKEIQVRKKSKPDTRRLAAIRKEVSRSWGIPVLSKLDSTPAAVAFSLLDNARKISNRGPLTPDHIIRTKRTPIFFSGGDEKNISDYARRYTAYFEKYSSDQKQLDGAPRWGIIPGHGTLSFGPTVKSLKIIEDIARHTKKAIVQAEALGGWKVLGQRDLFEMEYWSLEQAKLKKSGPPSSYQGKLALVTGAANGIGKACVEHLVSEGATVAALDIDKKILNCFSRKEVLPLVCDVTSRSQIVESIKKTVCAFGGIDMLITNAGIFPVSQNIADMNSSVWSRSMEINVTSHQVLLQECLPFLELGIDPAIVILGSKNVPAPGPGAGAYSVAKAGLTQLGRVAAMEFGSKGIRVNILHPNAVYDTGIWTPEVLEARARHYGLSVEAYKKNNLLRTEVTSGDVAKLAVAMLGPLFSKVTGAQLPIDGGNDRVI